jgi:predicted N-acetyltransferase YhbS
MGAVAGLSFVIKKEQKLVASLRFWPAVMSSLRGMPAPREINDTILLGPIAVSDAHGSQGLGQKLIAHGIAAAQKLGYKSVVLVGDESYYEKMGFSRAAASTLYIERFNDYDRLLGLELEEGHLTSKEYLLEPVQNSAAQKAA